MLILNTPSSPKARVLSDNCEESVCPKPKRLKTIKQNKKNLFIILSCLKIIIQRLGIILPCIKFQEYRSTFIKSIFYTFNFLFLLFCKFITPSCAGRVHPHFLSRLGISQHRIANIRNLQIFSS